MRTSAILCLVVTLLCGSLASANTFVSLRAGAAQDPTEQLVSVGVSEPAPDAIRLEYDLAGFEMSPVAIDGRTYQMVRLPKEGHFLDAGAPELPNVCRSVIIPDNAEMEARVVSATYRDFPDVDVVPSKGNLLRTVDPRSVAYNFGSSYATDAWYPEQLVSQREPYILRDFRGLVVELHPFQYNPVEHVLRVYDRVVVEVVPVGPGQINVIQRVAPPTSINAEFGKLYVDHFLNFAPDRYAPIPEVGEMLVIAYDSFAPNMQPLIDWKNQMGVKATLVTKSEVGSTYQAFQTYIQNFYNSHDLAFVLLVGDNAQIPSPSNGGAPADPVYALVAGGDSYPDLFIGRLSAENTDQVNLQVQKFVEYEKLPQADVGWYRRGIGIGSGEGAGIGDDGEADWQHMENIRTDLLGFTYTGVDTIYDHYPYQATAQMVMNAVNAGRSIIDYCGHGSVTSWSTTGFSNSHVAQLVNYNKLPWIVSVACVNGAFQSGTCFAEAWLRAVKDGEPTGAVAMYASTVNMSWAPPMAAQDETVDLLVGNEKRTVGALCFSGSCQMIDEYGSGGISEFKNWHIFGDPSLRVLSDTPTGLTVIHEDTIEPDATTYSVTVPGTTGALCGLSKDGEYLGSAFTNGSGAAVIDVVGTLPEDSITLTVTYFNKLPYFAEIEVGLPLIPAMQVDPASFVLNLPMGITQTEHLYITNVGMEGSLLEYTLQVVPSMLNAWVRIDPRGGQCGYGETDDISVFIDTRFIEAGLHEATIVISADRLEAVSVPVTLYAGDYQGVGERDYPTVLILQPACPTPFTGSTVITCGLPQAGNVELGIFDMSGRRVRTLASGRFAPGFHHWSWDGRDESGHAVAGGVYLYRLTSGGKQLTEKVTMLR